MKQVAIDTDTVSYFFRSHQEISAKLDLHLNQFGFVCISVVTYYEVLNGLYFKDARRQLAKFEEFIKLNKVLPLTDEIAKKSAEIYSQLRKTGQIIGHNDVMIAATAIINGMKMVSNNTNHFNRIDSLDLENWSI